MNHVAIAILAKAVPRHISFSMDYAELLDIIEGYIYGLPHPRKLIIESDSLLTVMSLTSFFVDIFELGALVTNSVSKIDKTSISFSNVKREGYIPAHILARIALDSDIPLE